MDLVDLTDVAQKLFELLGPNGDYFVVLVAFGVRSWVCECLR